LGKYLNSIGKSAFVVSSQFAAGQTVFLPYLFDDEELAALFHAVDSYECKTTPFCPILLSTYFRLTYTCGLRPAEGRLLKRNEIDLNSGEIRIVNSKYHKSRNIVMSRDMNKLAKKYTVLRDLVFPESEYFFPSPTGGPYSAEWIQGKFKAMFAMSKPNVPKDLLPAVRVYDLRHRFATAVLQQWLDEKKELTSRLPYLRAYMGHKELASTEYYIHLLPGRLAKSPGVEWDKMNRVVPRAELWEK
jgi:integrase